MKKFLFLISFLSVVMPMLGQNQDYTIELTEAGQLELKVALLETSAINTLTIKGPLDGQDLMTLKAAKGKLSTVQTLDISGTTLVSDESFCYAEASSSDYVTNTYYYYYYYVSDNPREEIEYSQTGLGMRAIIYYCYVNDYAQVFCNTQAYKKVILPQLTSIGESMFSGNNVVEEVEIPEGLKYVGAGAFRRTTSMQEINLPESVDSVGNFAFRETSAQINISSPMKSVGTGAFWQTNISAFDFSEIEKIGASAFRETKLSGEIDLSGLEVIPEYAFEKTFIKKVATSSKLKEIGYGAFYGSTLENFEVRNTIEKIGGSAFYLTPFIDKINPNQYGIKYIGRVAYTSTNNVTDVVIKDGTISLTDGLFSYGKISTITLPSSLKYIGERAFFQCSNLSSIEWPEDLEEIGDNAFYRCGSLNFGAFNNKLKRIGREVFSECSSILELTLPESLVSIQSNTFSRCNAVSIVRLNSVSLDSPMFALDFDGLTHVIIGSKVETIPTFYYNSNLRIVRFEERDEEVPLVFSDNAFGSCPNLIECKLPPSTTHIGAYAFNGDENVDLGEFPQSIQSIGVGAFYNCKFTPFGEITLNLDSIPNQAFFGCTGLTEVNFSKEVKFLGDYCFSGTGLSSFQLPKLVMNSDDICSPFSGAICENLKTVTFEEGTTRFNISLEGTTIEDIFVPDGIVECGTIFPSTIKTVSFPRECLNFTRRTFFNCTPQISWRVPEFYVFEGDPSNNAIPYNWFRNCQTPNNDLILPEGIGNINYEAFSGSSLYKLSFPYSLQWISQYALYFTDVAVVEFKNPVPPETDGSLFGKYYWDNVDKFVVPYGAYDAYASYLLKNYKTKIVEAPPVAEVKFAIESLTLNPQESIEVPVIITPEELDLDWYSCNSSDRGIATATYSDNQVSIKGKKAGSCAIEFKCIILGTTYVATLPVTVLPDSGIDIIELSGDAEVKIYNVEGKLLFDGVYRDATLLPGIYLVNNNGKIQKILIR